MQPINQRNIFILQWLNILLYLWQIASAKKQARPQRGGPLPFSSNSILFWRILFSVVPDSFVTHFKFVTAIGQYYFSNVSLTSSQEKFSLGIFFYLLTILCFVFLY
jgi:hypothetical protein